MYDDTLKAIKDAVDNCYGIEYKDIDVNSLYHKCRKCTLHDVCTKLPLSPMHMCNIYGQGVLGLRAHECNHMAFSNGPSDSGVYEFRSRIKEIIDMAKTAEAINKTHS